MILNWKENKETGSICFEVRTPRKKNKELLRKNLSKIYGSNFIMEKNKNIYWLKNKKLWILFHFFIFSFFQVPHRDFSSNETHSVLRYKPESDNDFGYLYCWAENVLGRMELPCAFQLIPAGKSLLKHINILKM